MENLDFEIEIDLPSGRDYPVTVVHSPAGEGRGTLHFPYDELALDNHLTKLQLALLNSGRGQRRVVPAEEKTVREFGTSLFDALFAGEVRTLLDVSRHEARSKGTGLRVKLRCRAPELAALPWEFLFDTEVDEYLCLSRQTPLVRYLEVSTPCEPLKVALPLRILGVVASPKDLDSLDVDREKQRVEQAVAHLVESGKVELEWLAKPTWRELQTELSRRRWHVVHFVGHGGFDQRRDEGVLAFEDDDGNAHLLGAGDVGLLLGDHDDLRLAVLNACEGARSSARDVFSSTAAVLVRKGTPGVVAMQYEITDLAAIELARSFYDCIAAGQPVDTAMSEARKAVRLSLPGTLEWGTPVLFMRAPDGVLFDVSGSPTPTAQPEVARERVPSRPRSAGGRPRLPGTVRSRVAVAAALALVVAGIAYALWPDKAPVVSGGAHLLTPAGLAVTADGTVLVGDVGHHQVKAIRDGKVTVYAGSGKDESTDGPVAQAGVGEPGALAVTADGTVFFGDHRSQSIRRISNGQVTTIQTESGEALWANDLTMGPQNVLVATDNQVWGVNPVARGPAVKLAGTGTNGFNADGIVATQARLDKVDGIALGPDRTSFYIADGRNYRVRRVGPDSKISTFAGSGSQTEDADSNSPATQVGIGWPTDIAFDAAGNLYVLNGDGRVVRVPPDGSKVTTVLDQTTVHVPSKDGKFAETTALAVTPKGDIYLLDDKLNRVFEFSNGVVTTVG